MRIAPEDRLAGYGHDRGPEPPPHAAALAHDNQVDVRPAVRAGVRLYTQPLSGLQILLSMVVRRTTFSSDQSQRSRSHRAPDEPSVTSVQVSPRTLTLTQCPWPFAKISPRPGPKLMRAATKRLSETVVLCLMWTVVMAESS